MRIVALSDTHNRHKNVKVPPGDVLIHAGDFTAQGGNTETRSFLKWFQAHPHRVKILIAGNHDLMADHDPEKFEHMLSEYAPKVIYLHDERNSLVVDGVRFSGTAWVPRFGNWAFMKLPTELDSIYHWLPETTDVLITHGPPKGILDRCENGDYAGCYVLRHHLTTRLEPQVHLFGHIHEGYGEDGLIGRRTRFLNVATCDENYQPVNPVVVFEVESPTKGE